MASALELSLQQQMLSQVPTETILNEWINELHHSQPKPEECLSFFHFAYNTGLWKKVFEALPLFLEKRWPIHWGILIQLCEENQLDCEPEVVESFLKGARKQNLVHLLVLSRAWDLKAPEIIQFRKRVIEKILQDSKRQRETLWEKLGFLRTQRMVEEEGKLLKVLRRMYPGDEQITKELEDYQDRWARHFLSSRSEQKSLNWAEHTPAPPTQEESDWIAALVTDMISISDKKPHSAYWFSVGLYMMGSYTESLKVLELAPESAHRDWLRVEILIKARRFVEVLTVTGELESRYVDDPETSFAVHYLRALAYKGLGQHSNAIELLRSLITIRPNYRSAQSLLSAWLEEGS